MVESLAVVFPENARFTQLNVADPVDPTSWSTVTLSRKVLPLTANDVWVDFLEDFQVAYGISLHLVWISVSQDDDGQHNFVNLAEAAEVLHEKSGRQLRLYAECDVKASQKDGDPVMFYARAGELGGVQNVESLPRSTSGLPGWRPAGHDELCPHSSIFARNYSVIPDLSMGPTQRLILCDQATLTAVLPEERIFEHLTLIVNCHETHVFPGKYRVGVCGTGEMPDVICQAVHTWYNASKINSVNDKMQEAMWKSLQTGTVAVHCLAGIHRAACIVACHFLWRHYVLGHRDIPCDPVEIYRRLKAVRPAVSPAYTHVLQSYQEYLRGLHAA
eukprot:TRINITY_DN31450_c0_g2_i1.p1 TRINITY_DN31450_c0_g2~~TRINITY_DN31450_c0_g2_i1.p1  ORF type:complete len:331 (-),score=39.73 TRINITY_DN31450_c0_g2_i1:28-1020(-)